MEELIKALESTGNELYWNNTGYAKNRGKEILRNVKYIKSLPNDEDRALFLKTNKDMRSFVEEINNTYGRQVPEIKKAYDSISYPKSVKRDENGIKTIDEASLVQMANADNAEDLFDVNSKKSWYNWTKAQMDKYAADAGMTRGEFIKKVAELDTANKRKHVANDGAMGVVSTIFFPRIQKAIEKGEDPSYADWALDVAENAAQAVPVNRVMGATAKGAKMLNAVEKTEKLAPTTARLVFENGIVPTTFASIDAAREGYPMKGLNNSITGTITNITTPRYLRGGFRFVGNESGLYAKALDDVIEKGNPAVNLAVNKLGKQKYGTSGMNTLLSSIDPTGLAAQKLSEGDDKEEVQKQQREREEKRIDSINKDHYKMLINSGMMERAMRRKHGDANVDLWLDKPQYAPDQILFSEIKKAKEKGYDEKL